MEANQVINRYSDYLQCNYCNDEIEINDNYFIYKHIFNFVMWLHYSPSLFSYKSII